MINCTYCERNTETAKEQTQMPNTGFYVVYMSYMFLLEIIEALFITITAYCVRNSKRANSTS